MKIEKDRIIKHFQITGGVLKYARERSVDLTLTFLNFWRRVNEKYKVLKNFKTYKTLAWALKRKYWGFWKVNNSKGVGNWSKNHNDT